jgi:hypothetical protein
MLYIGLGSAAVAIVETGPKPHEFVEVEVTEDAGIRCMLKAKQERQMAGAVFGLLAL